MSIKVILFRTPSSDACSTTVPDPYHYLLASSRRYTPAFLQVLDQAFVKQDQLASTIAAGPGKWSGIVATSKRAGEAWAAAAKSLAENQQEESGKGKNKQSDEAERLAVDWSRLPLFTPGPGTTSAFVPHDLPSRYFPKPFPGADSTGSGIPLGNLIVDNLSAVQIDNRPFLILEGDKTISELKDVLSSHGVPFERQLVYETAVRKELDLDMEKLVLALLDGQSQDHNEDQYIWLAFFSPSSAIPVISSLRTLGDLSADGSFIARIGDSRGKLAFRFAAIGKTTSDSIQSMGLPVSAIAQDPTARGILEALVAGEDGPQ
jgi:uroporphyrinogen-III synthase